MAPTIPILRPKAAGRYADQALSLRQKLSGKAPTEDRGRALLIKGDLACQTGDTGCTCDSFVFAACR